jgi:DNA polymerase III epsilon subunit-like protein
LLSVGACTLGEPRETFYVELQPDKDGFTADAVAVSGLSLETLKAEGTPPAGAMQAFDRWLARVTPEGAQPVFVAFNAPFDWMFVDDYFHRYLGHNPFGYKALDIKAYYMGLQGVSWAETSHGTISRRYSQRTGLTHHALQDAIDEAELFEAMLAEQAERHREEDR